MEGKVDKLHLVYTIIIFVIVLLAIWLASPYIVCEEVLTKFEFAATITSIVLAVVSIIYSMYSGQGVSQNLGSMRDASEKIGDVGNKLESIQEGLQDDIFKLTNMETNMQTMLSEIRAAKGMIANLGGNYRNDQTTTNDHEFVFEKTSIVGKCIIYACKLSKEQNKPFPANLVGNPSYLHGYITALETCAPSKFRVTGSPNGFIEVMHIDEGFFELITKQYINQEIRANRLFSDMEQVMHNIDTYFAKTN